MSGLGAAFLCFTPTLRREIDLRSREPNARLLRPIVTFLLIWAETCAVSFVIATGYVGLKLVVLQSRIPEATTDWSAVIRSALLACLISGVGSALYAVVASRRNRNAGYYAASLTVAAVLIAWIYYSTLTEGALGTTHR